MKNLCRVVLNVKPTNRKKINGYRPSLTLESIKSARQRNDRIDPLLTADTDKAYVSPYERYRHAAI